MSSLLNERRRFIKTGLVLPLLATGPWDSLLAATSEQDYRLPKSVMPALHKLYGDQVYNLVPATGFRLAIPDRVDNDNVPVSIVGEKGQVISLAVLSPDSKKPLANYCKLFGKSDLKVGFRIKLKKEGYLYLVVETPSGLQYTRKRIRFEYPCKGG